jgi:hypothetical protein
LHYFGAVALFWCVTPKYILTLPPIILHTAQ